MNEDGELIAAVEALLSDPRTDPGIDVETVEQAARAVGLLEEGLRAGPGVFRLMAEGGQRGAETLSSDRLQVLSEMVQNADDMGASQVRFIWRSDELLIAHDGKGVRLADILLLGLPWLSGKTSDAEATGRFGIGLATLRALATTWEVHCHPFHVRFADLSIRSVGPLTVSEQLAGPDWTVFRIPLAPGVLSASELFEWFETWNDSSLLFLRHVTRVEALSDCPDDQVADDGTSPVTLRLSWTEIDRRRIRIDGEEADARVREARTTGGALWRVYDAQVAPHGASSRRHKAVGASMPVAVALPVLGPEPGSVHAGLPVAELGAAARVHAQFDPVVSREGFAASRWNEELVPLVADLWAAAVLDVLSGVEPSAWHLVPLPPPSAPLSPARVQDSVRAALVDRARTWLASRISLPCPDGTMKPLSALAVEEPQLSEVLADEDIARLAGLSSAFPRRARDGAHRWREVLTDWRREGTGELADEVRVRDALMSLDDTEYGIGQTIRLTAVAIEEGLGPLLRSQPCVIAFDGRRLRPTATGVAFAEYQDDELRGTGPLDSLGIVVDLHAGYAENSHWSRHVLDWLRKQDCLVRRDDTAAVLRRIERMGRAGTRIGDVLAALGVNGDPDVPQLIRRLRELRNRSTAPDLVDERLQAEVYLVYRALAGRLRSEPPGTSHNELRRKVLAAFDRTDSVLTDQGWRRAGDCFRGPTILRGFRPFTIPDPELNPLWDALRIEEPRPEDLADVLKEIARSGAQLQTDQQRLMLEALRSLADTVTSAEGPVSLGLRAKLRWLPLRTTLGWTKDRPVYAVDHPAIARTLGERLHVWQPGGDLQQFVGLLGVLKVHRMEASEACVVAPDRARPDRQLTEGFRWAVTSLQDTLVRDEPAAAEAFTDWPRLLELEVRVLPGLRVRLDLGEGDDGIEVPLDAHVDREAKVLFVRDPEALKTTRGGGLAVAALFSAERAHVGHRWRDLWEEGRPQDGPVTPLVPSGRQDHEDRERLASQLRKRELPRPSGPVVPAQPGGPMNPPTGAPSPPSIPAPLLTPTPSGAGSPPIPPSAEPRKLVSLAELRARSPRATRSASPSQPRSAPSSKG